MSNKARVAQINEVFGRIAHKQCRGYTLLHQTLVSKCRRAFFVSTCACVNRSFTHVYLAKHQTGFRPLAQPLQNHLSTTLRPRDEQACGYRMQLQAPLARIAEDTFNDGMADAACPIITKGRLAIEKAPAKMEMYECLTSSPPVSSCQSKNTRPE